MDLTAPAIRLQNLGKRFKIYPRSKDRLKQILWRGKRQYYQDFWALRHLDLEVQRGEQLSIIGRNGSGKSTLLQLICGTLAPTEGIVECNGRIAALLELGSGFNPEFTGLENIQLNAALLGLSRSEIEERLDDILAFADIGDFVDQPVKAYSSGMMVRLAFAVIAHVNADILICDEALSVGDAVFTQRCMRFIRSFRETGTLLFVSHDMSSVSSLTERCLWIHQGSVRFYGDTKAACESYADFCQEQGGYRLASQATSQHGHHCDGIASIRSTSLLTLAGEPIAVPEAGALVCLHIQAELHADCVQPFVGYQVTNSRGQVLFGDNTLSQPDASLPQASAGQCVEACFTLTWPRLASGAYSLTVAISSGTRESHLNHHWIHDALVFEQASSGAPMSGLFAPHTSSSSLCVVARD